MGAVSVYLDTSVIVALFVVDPLNDRAETAMRNLHDQVIVSDLSGAEFASVIAQRVRTRDLSSSEAQAAFDNFDLWSSRYAQLVGMEGSDVSGGAALLRRLDLPLRTPDALHIAITRRIGCPLLTFDRAMEKAARALGVNIVKT